MLAARRPAKKAAEIFVSKNLGFMVPSIGQKLNYLLRSEKRQGCLWKGIRYRQALRLNTSTGEYLELDLTQLFGRARGIYPGWSLILHLGGCLTVKNVIVVGPKGRDETAQGKALG